MIGFQSVRYLPPGMTRETPIGNFPRAFAHPSKNLTNVRRLVRFRLSGKCSCQHLLEVVEGTTKNFTAVLYTLFGKPLQDTHDPIKDLGECSLALETFVVLLGVRDRCVHEVVSRVHIVQIT